MKQSLSLASKLIVLVFFAFAFGAAVLALSARSPHSSIESGGSYGTTKNFEKKFSVQPGGLLVLSADAGDITIVGVDSQELSANVVVRGSEELVGKYDVGFEQEGNTIRINGKHSRKFFHLFDYDSFEARYEIQLPRRFDLQLETSGGDLTVRNVDGHMRGETSGGDVDVRDVSGNVRIRTSGGNIKLQNSSGELKLETSGGEIRAKMLTGNVDLETSGGNITVSESDAKLAASTSGGDIHAELKDNKGLILSTSGGNIVVTLPNSISAQVDATTTGGDVSCEFAFEGKIKDGEMHGRINGGGNLIQAETSGGDIELRSAD